MKSEQNKGYEEFTWFVVVVFTGELNKAFREENLAEQLMLCIFLEVTEPAAKWSLISVACHNLSGNLYLKILRILLYVHTKKILENYDENNLYWLLLYISKWLK